MDDPSGDSTWEDSGEEDGDGPSSGGDADGDGDGDAERDARPAGPQPRTQGARNWRAMRDTARYRRRYPGLDERDSGDMPNLSFYRNETRFLPNGCFIEDILQSWRDNYELLEDNHSYIQWLFPLREPGVNWHATPLTLQEIEAFKSSPEVQERLVQAYELMLGFYGIRLEDRDTGRVCRAHNYLSRFQNLNCHSHNNLRLTRILKSLGELGLERLQAPLVHFFLEETLVRGQLPAVRQSALDYFLFTVRCRHQRRRLLRFAWEHFRPRALFVWAPLERLQRLSPPDEPDEPRQDAGAPAAREDGAEDRAEDGAVDGAAEPVSPDAPPSNTGTRERDPGREAGDAIAAPASPKESKKRKLEGGGEQAPAEPGPHGVSEVERIALNLEGCALSQAAPVPALGPEGDQDAAEPAQPSPEPPGAEGADEARKRRKVVPAADSPPGSPESGEDENEVQEKAEGQAEPGPGAPVSPAVPADVALASPQEP